MKVETSNLKRLARLVAGVEGGDRALLHLGLGEALALRGVGEGLSLEVRLPPGEPEFRAVPAKLFAELVEALPQGEVELIYEGSRLRVEAGPFLAEVATAPAEGDPFPSDTPAPGFLLPPKELLDLLTVAYAADRGGYRGLKGVYLHRPQGEAFLRGVATDGYRLALAQTPLGAEVPPVEALLPLRFAEILGKALRALLGAYGGEEPLEVALWGKGARFTWRTPSLLFRLEASALEGKFPDYERVLPKSFSLRLRLGRMGLLEALERLSALAAPPLGRVDLKAQGPGPTSLVLEVQGDHGQAQEVLHGAHLEGGSLEVAFNLHYLGEALEEAEGEEVSLGFSPGGGPVLLEGEGGPKAVLVPLRT